MAPASRGRYGSVMSTARTPAFLVGGEDQRVGDEAARPVRVQVVRPMAALAGVVGLGRSGEGSDADRVGGLGDVENPRVLGAVGHLIRYGLVGDDKQPARGQRQRGVGAAAVGRRPVAARDQPRVLPVSDIEQREPAVPPGRVRGAAATRARRSRTASAQRPSPAARRPRCS